MKYNMADMYALDLYLSNADKKDYKTAIQNITVPSARHMSLLSWDLYMNSYNERLTNAIKRNEFGQILSYAEHFKWQNNLDLVFSENDYEALIITDKNQKIIWVNDGFTSMTGYSKSYALSKTPRFLQGEQTSIETKKRIKNKIAQDVPFEDVIINHRKDNTTYKCEIKVFPLFGENTTHYLALEKEIK
ncbi:MAG: hypothetical protein Wins2KO_14870 [Winogradskyella sp.]|uniref:PAS domain-containing protein n=1 Tax=Winogradskyella sp. TaxID=1883156 RepID=UPI0025D61F10|nr:PAS domain-containing protein [Winogradskyella sp.]NRB58785.1 PAS domain-containing protein [Winogradskyella sp.]